MVQVAMVEDNPNERARIRECLKYVEQTDGVLFDVHEYPTGLEFLGAFAPTFDLVFMDIEMPGMDGMETARALRKMDPSVVLIFVTNMAQYAISGYEVEALDFILKPINKYSFAIKLRRALTRVVRRTEDYISVKTDGEVRALRIASIRWLDVNGHYVVYHTTEGDVTEYTTLKQAAAKINRNAFALVNRSCLVNMHYIGAVAKDSVTIGDTRLDISRPQRKAFLAAMSEYMGGSR